MVQINLQRLLYDLFNALTDSISRAPFELHLNAVFRKIKPHVGITITPRLRRRTDSFHEIFFIAVPCFRALLALSESSTCVRVNKSEKDFAWKTHPDICSYPAPEGVAEDQRRQIYDCLSWKLPLMSECHANDQKSSGPHWRFPPPQNWCSIAETAPTHSFAQFDDWKPAYRIFRASSNLCIPLACYCIASL